VSLREILQISQESWDSKDPQSFYRLLLLKLVLAIGAIGVLLPLYVTIFVSENKDNLVSQGLMWLVFCVSYFKVKHDRQVFKAGLVIVNIVVALLLKILIGSRIGDASGAYHYASVFISRSSPVSGTIFSPTPFPAYIRLGRHSMSIAAWNWCSPISSP
jgi:hypothetical protein